MARDFKANGYHGKNGDDYFNTSDYVLLLDAARLDQYVVQLNYYPWLPEFTLFAGWQQSGPSKTLQWYDAYNQVKHDREGHFAEATLDRTITAVAACFVMLAAQYGWDFAVQGAEGERAFFQLNKGPEWAPSEIYIPAYEGDYRPVNYPFGR